MCDFLRLYLGLVICRKHLVTQLNGLEKSVAALSSQLRASGSVEKERDQGPDFDKLKEQS